MNRPRARSLSLLRLAFVTVGTTALLLFWHSQWYCAEIRIGQAVVITSKGRVSLAWSESPRLFAKFSSFTFRFEPAWGDFSYRTARYMPILTQHNSNSAITFPLWTLATLLIPGILLLYFPRPFKPNHCPHCRYNREGLPPNSPCPECGKPANPLTTSPVSQSTPTTPTEPNPHD